MARRFFYIAAGMFLLALSYHLGAGTATAQPPGNPVVGIAAGASGFIAVTANGDTYQFGNGGPNVWHGTGNVFGGSPTPAVRESWGQVKARYRTPAGGSVTPGVVDR